MNIEHIFPVSIIHNSLRRDHFLELFEDHVYLVIPYYSLPIGQLEASVRGANDWDILLHMCI